MAVHKEFDFAELDADRAALYRLSPIGIDVAGRMARDAVVAVVWHGELGTASRAFGFLPYEVEGRLDLGMAVVAEEAGEAFVSHSPSLVALRHA